VGGVPGWERIGGEGFFHEEALFRIRLPCRLGGRRIPSHVRERGSEVIGESWGEGGAIGGDGGVRSEWPRSKEWRIQRGREKGGEWSRFDIDLLFWEHVRDQVGKDRGTRQGPFCHEETGTCRNKAEGFSIWARWDSFLSWGEGNAKARRLRPRRLVTESGEGLAKGGFGGTLAESERESRAELRFGFIGGPCRKIWRVLGRN